MQQPVHLVLIRDDLTGFRGPALAGVRRQPVPQRLEGKGLQHVLNDPDPRGRLHRGDLARRRHRDHVRLVAEGPHPPYDVQPVPVRQVHVEQHQVDLLAGEHLQRARRSTGDSGAGEAGQAFDVRAMCFCGDRIVLDDEYAQVRHSRSPPAATALARSTPVLRPARNPDRPSAYPASARPCSEPAPVPARAPARPSSSSRARTSCANSTDPNSAPVFVTVRSTASAVVAARSSTCRGAGPPRAASIALSSRLPTTVTTSWAGSRVFSVSCPSSSVSRTPRSCACGNFASSSDASTGSPTVPTTRSVIACANCSSDTANSRARSGLPISIRLTTVCSRFEASWFCACSDSARLRTASSSPSSRCSWVWSRSVTIRPRPGRLLVHHDDAARAEVQFVVRRPAGREQLGQGSGEAELLQRRTGGNGAQPEQGEGLVVDELHPAVEVEQDQAFARRVQYALVEVEHPGQRLGSHPRVARRTRQVTSALPAIATPSIRLAMPSIERMSSRTSSDQLGAARPVAAASRSRLRPRSADHHDPAIAIRIRTVTVCIQSTWRRSSHGGVSCRQFAHQCSTGRIRGARGVGCGRPRTI